ncbi:hypothetical protein sos41_32780 [Alphaproteobacteria bacterium SO-S41]|nr:hypothetical protein sos41_32780 [Alphaproteobacteria bacterium SO-S41]
MAGGEDGQSGDAVMTAIPLVVAPADETAPRPRFTFHIPRVFDYLIVATFIYFFF